MARRINRLRDTILTDGRTISFKDRNSNAVQRRAEPHFLAAANTIPGVVATILVDRTVPSVRMFPPREEFAVTGSNTPAAAMFTNWKQPTFERLMRIAWFGTTIFAGLSTPQQHLLWITDNDDIVANDGRTQTFGVSVAAVRLSDAAWNVAAAARRHETCKLADTRQEARAGRSAVSR